jgi:hypothetical protein
MIPNLIRKNINGQSNYLGMVTSQKMKETEMGYRGSKSEIKYPNPNIISVKEQRVDGSWLLVNSASSLRCTLMGCENNYQIINPSKQLKSYFSTLNSNQNVQLNPYWVTGFTDGEGSFTIDFYKLKNRKLGWRIQTRYSITLHKRDLP